ncbi:MAG: hypothetical protein GY716_16080 [bacterium]|nr:hypothetical protein [bacterium]
MGAEREGWVCGGERARDFAGSAPRATRQRVWDKPRHLKASADGIRRKLDEKLASGALSPEAQHHVERGMDTGMHEYHAPQIIEP